jgi:cytochrome c-type biogenesis protein CcmH
VNGRAALVALVAAGLLLLPSGALGGPADVANDVSSSVMSPFCPGVTLHDCPSDAATHLRVRIERWARAGLGRDAIVERLRAQYGPVIDAAPPRSGAGLIAWLGPAAAVLCGALVAWSLTRRWARSRARGSSPGAPPSAQERARLDAELAQLQGPP